jgi:hypothetical protein
LGFALLEPDRSTQPAGPGELERPVGRFAVAVLWLDRCVLRLYSGLRLHAATTMIPRCDWSAVQSVLFSAMVRSRRVSAAVPTTIEVLAGAHVPAPMAITLTWGTPSHRHAAEPAGWDI